MGSSLPKILYSGINNSGISPFAAVTFQLRFVVHAQNTEFKNLSPKTALVKLWKIAIGGQNQYVTSEIKQIR